MPDKKKKPSLMQRMLSIVRQKEATELRLAQETLSDTDLRKRLEESIAEIDNTFVWIEAVYPDDEQVVYACAYNDYMDVKYYRQNYDVGAGGEVTLNTQREEVRTVISYETLATARAAACGCATHPAASAPPQSRSAEMATIKEKVQALIDAKDNDYTEKDRDWLEKVPENRLDLLTQTAAAKPAEAPASTVTATPAAAPATTPAVAPAATATPAATTEAPKIPTAEEYVNNAPEEVRDVLQEGMRAAKERKASSIAAIKATGRCDFTDAELQSKSQRELDGIAKLASAPVQSTGIVDFSAQGGPRAAKLADDEKVPAAKSIVEHRAARRGATKTSETPAVN